MINKTIKNIFFTFLILTQANTFAMVPAAPQEPGILATLANDAVSLAKWTGYGIAGAFKGLGNLYLVARNHPGKTLVTVGGSLILGRWLCLKSYEDNIKPIEDRSKNRQYSNWASNFWENHSTLAKQLPEAVIVLQKNFQELPKQQIIDGIKKEVKEISEDMEKLENMYLVCKAPLDITLYNIKSDFEKAGEECADSIACAKLNFEQFKKLKKDMASVTKGKILPYFFLSFNYTTAAHLWWNLKKIQLKLEVLANALHLEKRMGYGNDQQEVHLRGSFDPA